jgi:hypothetical protein
MKRTIRVLSLTFVLGAVGLALDAAPAAAEPEAPAAKKSELPPGFEPIAGKEEEAKVDPNPLVVAAYGAILGGLLLYVILMARQQGRLSKEIAELAAEVSRKTSA